MGVAVSGQKVSDIDGSVCKGSEEDFDHSCEQCYASGQYEEAHGFCLDCREFLCVTCFACHQRTKAFKHHQLLDKDSIGKHNVRSKDSAMCTEKCAIHKNEIIKFFCTDHEFLGCTDCISLNHNTCTIDYIPDKCTGIGDSDEYRETLRELDQMMKDIDVVIQSATTLDNMIEPISLRVRGEISKFNKKITDGIHKQRRQIYAEARNKHSRDRCTVQKVLNTCTAASSDIKKFKASLEDNKTLQQDGQIYIMIRQAKSKFKSDNLKNVKELLKKTRVQYTFEGNKELENLLTKQNMFGKLHLSSNLVTLRQKKVFDTFTHVGHINIKSKSDHNECYITGCARLSSNKVMLADYSNNKLKVDTKSKLLTAEKSFDSAPWDIAVLPQDQIAVTMTDKRNVLVMARDGKFSIIRSIPVNGYCRGVIHHNDYLYVVCRDPYSVHIIDIQGTVNTIIFLNNKIFDSPNYILVSKDARHIYISNFDTNSVASVTLQGGVSAVYMHKDLKGPERMLMLDDGSFLVCCYSNNTIHHISGDLKQGQKVLDGLKLPQSICYIAQEREVYIGGECGKLKILKNQ